jgi:hypothetical protein
MAPLKQKSLVAPLTMLLAVAGLCCADPIDYQVDDIFGFYASTGQGVVGTIETDGTTGTLAASDILGWNLVLSDGLGDSFDITNENSTPSVTGTALTATASALQFNFGTVEEGGSTLGDFEILDSSNGWGWTFAVPPGTALEGVPAGPYESSYNYAPIAYDTQPVTIGTATPEPSGFVLLSAALGMIGVLRQARNRRQRS